MRILIVDDSDPCSELIALICRRAGHAAVVEPNGMAALDYLANEAFDLVLLDAWMPEIDGLEIARRLRRQPGRGEVPVAFVTAVSQPSTLADLQEVHPIEVLLKPFSPRQLVAVLDKTLQSAKV